MTRDHAALVAYLDAAFATPFDWTLHGCCVGFAAGAVKAQTGVDVLAGVERFKTMRGAANRLRARGGFYEAVSSRLDEIPPAMAMRGDIALVVGMGGLGALMVVEGDMLVGPGETGLIRMPREAMIAAWDAGSAAA